MDKILITSDLPDNLTESHRLYVQTAQRYNQVIDEFEKLQNTVAWFKRNMFGRKSERYFPDNEDQLELDGLPESEAESEEIKEEAVVVKKRKKKKGHGRSKLPEDIPRERIELNPPAESLICSQGHDKVKIGEEITEELEVIPASFIVKQYVRPKYACKVCGNEVVIADLPARPIEKGRPGPGLLAHICISKYGDHLPLVRQVKMFKRHGIHFSKQTLAGWLIPACELLLPIVEAMKRDILKSFCIQSDDTPLTVLLGQGSNGKSHRGYMWVYIGDKQQVIFDYTEHRNRAGPVNFVRGYKGYLQADAYSGYNECFAAGDIKEVGCWAHNRRKYVDALESEKGLAEEMLSLISELYAVERFAKEEKMSAQQRYDLRQKKSKPLLAQVKEWLDKYNEAVLPKSPIGQAITYSLNQWEALNRYLEDGRLEIDNNLSERVIRNVVIGRKNYLFAGSHEGARRAAILYSLICTCNLLGINIFDYLKDVFERIATHPINRIRELTPLNWQKTKQKTDNEKS